MEIRVKEKKLVILNIGSLYINSFKKVKYTSILTDFLKTGNIDRGDRLDD